jgi:hypothetical protein
VAKWLHVADDPQRHLKEEVEEKKKKPVVAEKLRK